MSFVLFFWGLSFPFLFGGFRSRFYMLKIDIVSDVV
jgi:hypothetical protein